MNEENKKINQKNKLQFVVSIVVLVVVTVAFVIYLARCTPVFNNGDDTTESTGETTSAESTDTTAEEIPEITETEAPPLPENPIDFSEQMALNDEIYAWIYIPNTNVNYPILQSATDDLFYLRKGVDKNYNLGGVIFSQSHNKKDFKDPVTLVYGHNMTEDGSMFATLHNFEDTEFFNNNEDMFIYTPGHILKYKIISAFKYDRRHIMNSFNFDDLAQRREFFDYTVSPAMIPQNVREGVEVKDDDKMVVLSTCMANNKYRYLVCAVLVSDEPTK